MLCKNLDGELKKEAFCYAASVASECELINLALHEFVDDVRELRGNVKILEDYDYKVLRTDYGHPVSH